MSFQVIISSFLSGLLSSMGFGGGSVLIIYLTAFLNLPQLKAQGINLFFFCCTTVFALIGHFKNKLIIKKESFSFLPWCIIGLVIGYFILKNIQPDTIRKLFGGFLIAVGLKELFAGGRS